MANMVTHSLLMAITCLKYITKSLSLFIFRTVPNMRLSVNSGAVRTLPQLILEFVIARVVHFDGFSHTGSKSELVSGLIKV